MGNRVFLGRMRFMIHKHHGASARGPQRTSGLVVDFHTFSNVGSVTNVKAVVGTTKDIDEKKNSLTQMQASEKPFGSRARSLRAFDSPLVLPLTLLAPARSPLRPGLACHERASFGRLRTGSESNGGVGN